MVRKAHPPAHDCLLPPTPPTVRMAGLRDERCAGLRACSSAVASRPARRGGRPVQPWGPQDWSTSDDAPSGTRPRLYARLVQGAVERPARIDHACRLRMRNERAADEAWAMALRHPARTPMRPAGGSAGAKSGCG